jgi:hypothetical protein
VQTQTGPPVERVVTRREAGEKPFNFRIPSSKFQAKSLGRHTGGSRYPGIETAS